MMSNIVTVVDSNLCCNSLIKVNCWLILAKYKTSKLEVIKHATEDAALDEFETRLFLRNLYANSDQNDKFLNFAKKVYHETMLMITDYICSPDWSIFYDEGKNSIWELKNTIENEIMMASSAFNHGYHSHCAITFVNTRDQILSMIEPWSNAMYVYSNYISASLSEIFNDKMKKIICKYQYYPVNSSFKWLCDELMHNCGHDRWDHIQTPQHDHQFWFVNETLNLHYFDESFMTPCSYVNPFQPEEELAVALSHWLFRECISQLKSNTSHLVRADDLSTSKDVEILRKEELSDFLNVPLVNLEFQLKTYSRTLLFNFDISECPHYFVPDYSITELYPVTESVEDCFSFKCPKDKPTRSVADSECSTSSVDCYNDDEKTSFDLIDFIVANKDTGIDADYGCKLLNIKEELENFLGTEKDLVDVDVSNAPHVTSSQTVSNHDEVVGSKMQGKGRQELQKHEKMHDTYPVVQLRKRGRPKKVDDYSSNAPKNGQHKYSPEDVQDCSVWISDNFFEVAGNKPAIDRARMYELYTNYCLLKLCTPVDRALFGKIIRKVFPKLKSRRLIQNQVLKYHYVGLKPKYKELEQALLCSDSSSFNPSKVLVTYAPVEE